MSILIGGEEVFTHKTRQIITRFTLQLRRVAESIDKPKIRIQGSVSYIPTEREYALTPRSKADALGSPSGQ